MASEDVQLLTFWASPYAMRAELALAAEGVPYTKISQDPSEKSSLLLQSNPIYKKIPVLLHRGKIVCESMIIVQYLDEAFPSADGNDLLPKDPHDRAVARFWADFADRKITDALFRVTRTAGEQQEAALREAKEHLRTLEGELEAKGSGAYMGGARAGYVDIVMGPLVAWCKVFERGLELDQFPHLMKWMQAMRESALGECLPPAEKVAVAAELMRQKRVQQQAR